MSQHSLNVSTQATIFMYNKTYDKCSHSTKLYYTELKCFWTDISKISFIFACVHVCSVTKWFLTHCDPMDYNPPGSSAHGILQSRILKCVAISFFRGSSQPRVWLCVSYVSCTARQCFSDTAFKKMYIYNDCSD